jgi:predicted  nucleic acid-binding Zn-ribbon protein
MEKKEINLKNLQAKVNRNETKIRLTNVRINRLVDAIDKSKRVKGI